MNGEAVLRALRTAAAALRRRLAGRRRRWIAGGLVLLAVAAVAPLLIRQQSVPDIVRLVAAGNMACDPDDPHFTDHAADAGDHCRHDDVSTVAVRLNPTLLIGLGDYQFERPTSDAYRDVYDPSWGRLRERTVPVFGNQEYKDRDAKTFTDYFGGQVRDLRGYWSQDIGDWHLVVLNSNCESVPGGCATGSPQQQWLAADLSGDHHRCVVAAWHHPRWSSGIAGPVGRVSDLFRTLYDHRADLVLSAHDADYERYGPLDPDGRPDPRGVRQFVVGTGGQAHYPPDAADLAPRAGIAAPASEFVDYRHHGVLELELLPGGWRWRFHALAAAGTRPLASVADQGSARCT
jgi:hypothetical protein